MNRAFAPLAALLVAGCVAPTAGPSAPAGTPAASGPSGKVTIAINAQTITSMETGLSAVSASLFTVWPVFDGLTALDNDGKVQPALAASWRAADDKTWEFTLGDWTFQNGRAVTMADVTGTFARYRDPANRLSTAGIFANVDTIEGSGKVLTVKMKVTDPTFPTLVGLAIINPIQELNAATPQEFFKKPFGSGPYKVLEADFQNRIRYEAMGKDFKSPRGVPNVAEIELRVVPEASARVAALQTGIADFAGGLPVPSIKPLEDAGLTILRGAGNAAFSYLLDTRSGPTADLRVRQAINYAVDKEGIIKALYGGFANADGQLLGPNALGYNPNVKPFPFDPTKAKQLLAEAGYSNGVTLVMTHVVTSASPREVSEVILSQLRDVGITLQINVKEVAIWTQENNTNPKNANVWLQVINWDLNFEAQGVYRWFSSDYTFERGRRWDDEEFDRLYQRAKTTLDSTQRAALYQQAAVRLNSQAVCLFMVQPFAASAAKKGLTFPSGASSPRYLIDMKWA